MISFTNKITKCSAKSESIRRHQSVLVYSEINLRTLDLKEFLPGGTTKFVQFFFDLVLALVMYRGFGLRGFGLNLGLVRVWFWRWFSLVCVVVLGFVVLGLI